MDKTSRDNMAKQLRRLAMQIELNEIDEIEWEIDIGTGGLPSLPNKDQVLNAPTTGFEEWRIRFVNKHTRKVWENKIKTPTAPPSPSPDLNPGREIKDGGPPRKDRNDG